MAVMVTADVPGQTQEGYDGMLDVLGDSIRSARGFIGHYAGRSDAGGWTCIEVWETAEDATRFFATHVHPHLPPGITPKRTIRELHSCVRPVTPADVASVR
jgi:hypothetical protein